MKSLALFIAITLSFSAAANSNINSKCESALDTTITVIGGEFKDRINNRNDVKATLIKTCETAADYAVTGGELNELMETIGETVAKSPYIENRTSTTMMALAGFGIGKE